jgi:hypothetical protein
MHISSTPALLARELLSSTVADSDVAGSAFANWRNGHVVQYEYGCRRAVHVNRMAQLDGDGWTTQPTGHQEPYTAPALPCPSGNRPMTRRAPASCRPHSCINCGPTRTTLAVIVSPTQRSCYRHSTGERERERETMNIASPCSSRWSLSNLPLLWGGLLL